MSSQVERVVTELLGRILSGRLPAGQRVVELQFAQDLAVSRTPLRLALGELEKEGLLERLPTRGFRFRAFTMEQISDAVDVRGSLEGMAARLASERGLETQIRHELYDCFFVGQSLLEEADRHDTGVNAQQWSELNMRFHGLIVLASGNEALAATLQFVSRIPMAGANARPCKGWYGRWRPVSSAARSTTTWTWCRPWSASPAQALMPSCANTRFAAAKTKNC